MEIKYQVHNGNGNGHYSKNGNGHVKHNNGNGNGDGHTALLDQDRFSVLESEKPRLFSSKQEVIEKSGIRKNILLFMLFLLALVYISSIQISSSVSDRNAMLVAFKRTDLTSPKDGFLSNVFVKEGERVEKNQLLMKVASIEGKHHIAESLLEVEAIKRELQASRIELKISILKLRDVKSLKILGSIKKQAVEEAFLLYQLKQKKLESLQMKLKQAEANATFLQTNLRVGDIRAPYEGVVISDTKLKEKAFVKEGEFLLTVTGPSSVLEFALSEEDYPRISIGSKSRIKFYAFPEEIYAGEVIGFKSSADSYSKSFIRKRTIKALIQCTDLPRSIRNGMSAKVTIEAAPNNILRRIYHELF